MPSLLGPADVRTLLGANGLHPSKALGQHFLADPNTARRIVRLADVPAGTPVVEVGPGLGSLTLALCDAGLRVRALEIDRYVRPVLERVVDGCNVDVVAGDALTIDWRALLNDAPQWAMVANLPYNVATPMLLRALDEAPMVTRYLVMVQREVGERLAATPRTKAYGAVTVKVAFSGTAREVGTVPATVFVPRPNVESVLVRIDRHDVPPVDVPSRDALFALVTAGFATRRKMLRRALQARLGQRTDAVLQDAGIDPMARAETLDLEAWARLARAEASAP